MGVGEGGAAAAAPCVGSWRHGVLVRENVSGILVGNKNDKRGRKTPVLDTVEYIAIFFVAPFSGSWRCQFRGVVFSDVTVHLVWGRSSLACLQPQFHLYSKIEGGKGE